MRDHAVWPGALLAASGPIELDWFVLSWAAAKLGAGLVGIPTGPAANLPDVLHVPAEADREAPVAVPRRLSGHHGPPASVTFSRRGRPVHRTFTPASVAAIAPTLADLIARLRAAPGSTLALSGPASDPLLTLLAGVVLVGGGRVACAPEPAGALALAARYGAEIVALTPAGAARLAALDEDGREQLDLTSVETLVVGGGSLDAEATTVVDDLFGLDCLVDVYATADVGVAATRRGDEREHELLDGVEARTGAAGALELRSPLAASAAWTRTGDAARLSAGGGVIVP